RRRVAGGEILLAALLRLLVILGVEAVLDAVVVVVVVYRVGDAVVVAVGVHPVGHAVVVHVVADVVPLAVVVVVVVVALDPRLLLAARQADASDAVERDRSWIAHGVEERPNARAHVGRDAERLERVVAAVGHRLGELSVGVIDALTVHQLVLRRRHAGRP